MAEQSLNTADALRYTLDDGLTPYAITLALGITEQDVRAAQRRAYDEVKTAKAGLHAAYRERAQLVAWLATIHPAVITPAPDVQEDGWLIVYLYVAGRQLSWHVAPSDTDLFEHVERVGPADLRGQWDGHTTEQKYGWIRSMTSSLLRGDRPTAEEELRSCRRQLLAAAGMVAEERARGVRYRWAWQSARRRAAP